MNCVAFQDVSWSDTVSGLMDFSFTIRKSRNLTAEKMELEQTIREMFIEANKRCDKLLSWSKDFKKIHWYDEISEEELKKVNNIIVSSRDIIQSFWDEYNIFTQLPTKILNKNKKYVERFKDIVEEFEEAVDDIEVIFFHLPENKEFIESTKKLAILE